MKGLIILITLLLVGCSWKKDLVVREVKIPVLTKCKITKPDRPLTPFMDLSAEEKDIDTIVKSAIAEIEFRVAYEIKLETAIEECNK